ncbi:hypothetical protein A1D30_04805 [Acidovorax sp. GW101-3H11]|uniref:DUF2325 domain-containing protein n=1 Tax=Acidovorax sp. GW101-3H11 TaxID=1813946 RepID=UPI0007B5329C|nr:DUF2325 domain-containing protein [Acidovorax sp. GW101-3H11]KZT12390.1 hypothetical protein A1D30_04805 [Acidovorax sp. GW101-3H11]
MVTLPQEFLALCRQLGDAQQRCSAAMQAQARQIEALTAEVVRLRGAVIVRDTRLALARDELEQLRAASPGLPRRQAMARHIGLLAERITTLSRECLRWRQAAGQDAAASAPRQGDGAALLATASSAQTPQMPLMPPVPMEPMEPIEPHASGHLPPHAHAQAGEGDAIGSADLDASLAAADLVICQTGCISHDDYWRVQDHCRRTGKPCILVDQPLAVREAQALAALRPMVVLRVASAALPAASAQPEDAEI